MDLGLLIELDGTARITVEGHPLLFAGVVDIAQQFHLTGGALVDSEVRPVPCCLLSTSRPRALGLALGLASRVSRLASSVSRLDVATA